MADDNTKFNVLVTGGSSGLGLDLVKLYLRDGAEVYATGRNEPEELRRHRRFHFVKVDFAELEQVKKVIGDILSANISFSLVINNAGVLSPPAFSETADGNEYTFQVNFLAHLLINSLIVDSMDRSNRMKIALVTSPVHKYIKPAFNAPLRKNYRAFRTYSETKYYLLLLGQYLRIIYPEKELAILGLDPGIFRSGIYRMQKNWFHKLYRTGAVFMRSSARVARGFHRILSDDANSGNVIYRFDGKSSYPFPELNDESRLFLLSCQETVKIMR